MIQANVSGKLGISDKSYLNCPGTNLIEQEETLSRTQRILVTLI